MITKKKRSEIIANARTLGISYNEYVEQLIRECSIEIEDDLIPED